MTPAKIIIPPIKSQGIKSKLVPWIKEHLPSSYDKWIEPFMGTGVVGFNLADNIAIMADTNPHLISFYKLLNSTSIRVEDIRVFLIKEGKNLSSYGGEYYYKIRDRFNDFDDPLDFLFINRSCFNGMIRFNKNGKCNIPYCHKDNRFSKSYITKIVNQIYTVIDKFRRSNFSFLCQDFLKTIDLASENDIIYCDPPYIGRHVDYFNNWSESDEWNLFTALSNTKSKFILSTWHHNNFRENIYINKYWSRFNIFTRNHFYHVGAREVNRNSIVEAVITNFDIEFFPEKSSSQAFQYQLL